VGLHQFGETEVVAQSKLKPGQIVTSEMLAQTAARLARTGAFKSVQYSYRYSNGEIAVEFRVEEVGKFLMCAFDNFVWFTDRELLEAVQQAVPMFQGLAPESGNMPDEITAALNDLLKKRGIPGQVEHTLTGDISSGHLRPAQHLFLVSGITMPIRSVIFERTSILDKNLLRERSKPLIDNNYSREFVRQFADRNLLPLYEERGYLRAHFSSPTARTESDAWREPHGVVVTLSVDEGDRYVWGTAIWNGAQTQAVESLNSIMNMKNGELANGLKIRQGWEAIQEAYAKKGYIDARINYQPEFDDAHRTVTYRVAITEGQQYRMGALILTGLPDDQLESLRKGWRLATGQVFDASYLNEFIKNISHLKPKSSTFTRLASSIRSHPEKQTVDVSIEFLK
jgi:outer membrane translocation and assembly module TamA